MTTSIVRMYGSEKQARDAVRKLKAEGFRREGILLVTPSPKGDAESVQAIAGSPVLALLPRGHAEIHAEGVRQGRSMVAIRAPFGQGQLAKEILQSCDPTAQGPGVPEVPSVAWEVAAPLSSGLRIPTLWRNRPEPLSQLLGRATLRQGRTFEDKYPSLKDSRWTFSSRLGMPLLSGNQHGRASLSGRTGDAWKRSFGLPMLSREPAPFSRVLNMHLLTVPLPHSHPAPFSHRTGFPVLTHGRTFLSRLLGELASPHFALFGRNPLSSNAAPLSAMIGQPTLWAEPAPLSAKISRPVLSDDPTPLSSKLAMPLLARSPTPLSSLLRLPLLTRYL
jgi:hypothetical protein